MIPSDKPPDYVRTAGRPAHPPCPARLRVVSTIHAAARRSPSRVDQRAKLRADPDPRVGPFDQPGPKQIGPGFQPAGLEEAT